MEYRYLGSSGLQVSALSLGAWLTYGGQVDEGETIECMDAAREAGVTEDQAGHPAKVFGLSFVFALLAAYAFAVLIGPAPELMSAIHQGLIVGAAFAATSFGINYQFSNKSMTLWLIDGGYHTVQFGLYGLVLGLWH